MPRPDREASSRAVAGVHIPTSAGVFTAHFSEIGLAELDFPSARALSPNQEERRSCPVPEWLLLTENAVKAILSGRPPKAFPPFDLRQGSAFQERVWLALQAIPMGQTKTYGDIAREVGEPEASQSVGAACGANPIPLLIPCHRVVASGGKLGGFSGGLEWKKRLLAIEGVAPRDGDLPF